MILLLKYEIKYSAELMQSASSTDQISHKRLKIVKKESDKNKLQLRLTEIKSRTHRRSYPLASSLVANFKNRFNSLS